MAIDGHLGPITPLEAEHVAAAIMRDHLGFTDARVTVASGDGGVDVVAKQAVAQVKHWGSQVGRPAIQQLYGARGVDHSKKMVFFCSGGCSRQALAYANEAGVALFTFDAAGSYEAMNESAKEIDLTAKKAATEAKKQADREARQAEWVVTQREEKREREARLAERQARIDAGDIPLFTARSGCALPFVLLALLGMLVELWISFNPDPFGIVLSTIFGVIALLLFALDYREYRKLKRAAKRK